MEKIRNQKSDYPLHVLIDFYNRFKAKGVFVMDMWVKRILVSCLIIFFIVILLNFSITYLTPFIIAVLFASLINPIVNWIEKFHNIERSLAAFIVLSFFISVVLLFLFIGMSQVYLELNRLLHNLPDYNTLGEQVNWILQHNNRLEELINNLKMSPIIKETLNNNLQGLYNALKESIIYIVNYLLQVLKKLPLLLSILLLSCIATYFISRDIDKINNFIMGLFPDSFRSKIYSIEKELISSAIGFIRAELILILITGIIVFMGLFLIGNEYALILGITAAFLDFIPIIGPGLLFIPWVIFNMISGNLLFAIKLLIIFTIAAALRQGIEGKIIGFHLGLHPLATMMSFYVGFRLMGTVGFIIGPATLVLGKAIYNSGILSDLIGPKG